MDDFGSFLFDDDNDAPSELPTSLFDGELDALLGTEPNNKDNAFSNSFVNTKSCGDNDDVWGFGDHSVVAPIGTVGGGNGVQVPLYELSTEEADEEEEDHNDHGTGQATGFVLPSSIASTGRLRGAPSNLLRSDSSVAAPTLDSISGGTSATCPSARPAVSFSNQEHGTRTRAPPPMQSHWGDDYVQKVVGGTSDTSDTSHQSIALPTASEADKMTKVAATLLKQQEEQEQRNRDKERNKNADVASLSLSSHGQKPKRRERVPPPQPKSADKEKQERENEEKEERERMLDDKHVRQHYSDHSRAHTNRPTIQQRVQAKTLDQVFDALFKTGTLLQRAVDIMIDHKIPLPPHPIPNDMKNDTTVVSVDHALRGLLSEMSEPMYILTLGNLIDSFFAERNASTGHSLNEKIGEARICVAILLKVFFSAFGSVFTHSRGARVGVLRADFSKAVVPDDALTLSDVRLRRSLASDCRYALPIVTEEQKRARKENCEKHVNIKWMVDADNDWRKIVTQNSNPLMFVIRRISERYGVPSPHVLFELIEMDVRYPHTWQRLVYLTSEAVQQAEQARREQTLHGQQKDYHKKGKKQAVTTAIAAAATMEAIRRRTWFKFTDFCDQMQCGMLPWMDYAARLDSTRSLTLNEIVRNMSAKIRQESFATLNQKFTKFLYRSNPSVFANQTVPFHMHRAVFRYLWQSMTVNPSRNLMQFLAHVDKNKMSTVLRLLCCIDQLEDPLQPAHYLHCLVTAYRRKMLNDLVESVVQIEKEEQEKQEQKGKEQQEQQEAGKNETEKVEETKGEIDWRRAVERPISSDAAKRILSWLDLRCSLRPGQQMIVDRRYDAIFDDLRAAHEKNDFERIRKYAMIVERDTWLYPLPVIVRFMRQTSEGVHETVANADNYMNNPPTSHGRVNTNHHDPREKNVYYMAIYHAKCNNLKQTATVVHLNGPFAGTAFKSPTAAINHVLIGNSCCSGPKELSVLAIERSTITGSKKSVVYNSALTDDPQKYSEGRPKWVNLDMYVREQSRGRFGFFSAVDDLPAALKQRPIPYKVRLDAEEKEKGQYVEVEHKNVQYNGRRRNISQHVHVGALTHCVRRAFETLTEEAILDAESVVPAGAPADDAIAREQIEAVIAEKGYAQLYKEHVLATRLMEEDDRERDLFMSRFSEKLLEQQPLCVNTIVHQIIAPPHTIVESREQEDIERISRRKQKSETEKEREKRRVARERAQAEETEAKRKTFAILTQRREEDLQSKAASLSPSSYRSRTSRSSSTLKSKNRLKNNAAAVVTQKKSFNTRSSSRRASTTSVGRKKEKAKEKKEENEHMAMTSKMTTEKTVTSVKRKLVCSSSPSLLTCPPCLEPEATTVSNVHKIQSKIDEKSNEKKRTRDEQKNNNKDEKENATKDEAVVDDTDYTVVVSAKKKRRTEKDQGLTAEQKKEEKKKCLARLVASAKEKADQQHSMPASSAKPGKKKKKLTWQQKCALALHKKL